MPAALISVSDQDEAIFEAWQDGKGLRTIAREMRLSRMAVEQALDRVLPVLNQQTSGRSYKRQLFLMEDLNSEFYAIAKRDKSIEAAHLCARLNERICAMNGWTSVNIRMDPVAAQVADLPSAHEEIKAAILRVARGPNYQPKGDGNGVLAPPILPATDDQNRSSSEPTKDAS